MLQVTQRCDRAIVATALHLVRFELRLMHRTIRALKWCVTPRGGALPQVTRVAEGAILLLSLTLHIDHFALGLNRLALHLHSFALDLDRYALLLVRFALLLVVGATFAP